MEKTIAEIFEILKTKYDWDMDSFVTDPEHLQFVTDVIKATGEAICKEDDLTIDELSEILYQLKNTARTVVVKSKRYEVHLGAISKITKKIKGVIS